MKRTRGSAGMVTIEFMLGMIAAYLVLFVSFNFIAYQYGRGVVRASLDEATRVGSRVDSRVVGGRAIDCEDRMRKVLDESMGATFRAQVQNESCLIVGNRVVATADFNYQSFFFNFGDINTELSVSSRKERRP